MKRSEITEATHISGENDPEPQNMRKESIFDKINEFITIYLPELLLSLIFLHITYFDVISKAINNTTPTVEMIISSFFKLFFFCIIYMMFKSDYLNALRNHTVVDAIKLWNFTYIAIKNDKIIEILCMEEDKFNVEVFEDTDEAYRIEKIK